jgi:hypothetical protein
MDHSYTLFLLPFAFFQFRLIDYDSSLMISEMKDCVERRLGLGNM